MTKPTLPFRPPGRHRRKVSSRMLALALLLALTTPSSAQQTDSFFESALDGAWVGSLLANDVHYLMQLSLNVAAGTGIAVALLPDTVTGAPSEVSPLEATVDRVDDDGVDLTIDVPGTQERRVSALSFELSYDAVTDMLSGPAVGDTKGTATLRRMSPARPTQRLWSGTVKIAGSNTFVLLQLTETAASGGRFRAETLSGQAWIGAEQGAVEGTRNGKKLTLAVGLPSGDVTASLKLAKKDTLLKGSFTVNGAGVKAKLAAAGGPGKPMKLKTASPGEVAAGESTVVTLKGKNFSSGALAHVDSESTAVTAVVVRSAKALEITLAPDAAVVDGTTLSLRVVNGDGQVGERRAAVDVIGGSGGATVSFASQVQPIFNMNCAAAGCHNATSARAGLVLTQGAAFANLVNVASSQQPSVMRVAPGNADNSYLVRKIRGTAGIGGGRMPLNRTALTQAQIDTIVSWVNEGAAENRRPR